MSEALVILGGCGGIGRVLVDEASISPDYFNCYRKKLVLPSNLLDAAIGVNLNFYH